MQGRGQQSGEEWASEAPGLVVDLPFRSFTEDVCRSYLILLKLPVFRPERKVAVPTTVLAPKGHEETGPGFSLPFEESYRSAAEAVENPETPGFLKETVPSGTVPGTWKDVRSRMEGQPGSGGG